MRLILVHGINNEDNTREQIESDWLSAIREGWKEAELPEKQLPKVVTAYYAKDLADLTSKRTKAVGMGAGATSGDDVALEFLKTYQRAAGISDEEIKAAARDAGLPESAVGMGPPHEAWVIALATGLERILPTRGKYIARLFLKQAAVYLDNKAVTHKIDTLVRSQIFPDGAEQPSIIVAHSLGTVVSYRVLLTDPPEDLDVPLFITLGSPLGIEIVKKRLPARSAFPRPPVTRWINAVCKDDFVTLNRQLDQATLGYEGVELEGGVVNNDDDKHAIAPYLKCRTVAKAIWSALPG
jgi:hypothetical protein